MTKTLVKSEKEFVSLLTESDYFSGKGLEYLERFLGVTFPFKNPNDSTTPIWPEELDSMSNERMKEVEGYLMDPSRYKRDAESDNFPERYPCVVVSWFEDTEDRFGKMAIEAIDFVYHEEFE